MQVPGNPFSPKEIRTVGHPTFFLPGFPPTIRNPSIHNIYCSPAVCCLRYASPAPTVLSTCNNNQPFTETAPPPRFFHPGNIPVTQTSHGKERAITRAAGGMWTWRKSNPTLPGRQGEVRENAYTNSIYRISYLFYAKFFWCLLTPASPPPFNLCFHFVLGGLWLF